MFKFRNLIGLSVLIFFIPTPAKAEWVQMGLLKDNSEIYIDIDSATVKNSSVTFWQRRLFAIALPNGALTLDSKMIIDYNSGTIKTTRLTSFDSSGRVLFNAPVNEPSKLINANSGGADVADFLCR
jgi:hypothetical protein